MRVDTLHVVRDAAMLNDRQSRNNSHLHYHHPHSEVRRCPHHVALPDSEWGPDKDMQIRAQYQVLLYSLLSFIYY